MLAVEHQITCVTLSFLNDPEVRIVSKSVTKLVALW